MVHNGIEYGVMAAYAEGLNVIAHADIGKREHEVDAETTPLRDPQYYPYDIEIDAEPLLALRTQLNTGLEAQGVKLSVNDFVLKASAEALRRVPAVNSSWEGTQIRYHGAAHVAFAVALEDGLITPVVRDCHLKSVFQISTEAKALGKKAKDKNSEFRLMGFGHRVYKNYDPRAKVMQETCHEVLDSLGIKDQHILKVAMELERIALQDDYFVEKKLYPNIDFYSGITLRAIGFPVSMFTVLFAVARTVGWIAQWKEMIEDPEQKIGRPRQLYIGATERPYVPIERR